VQGDLRNLPDALTPLTKLPNWVCWKWEWRVDKKKGTAGWTKPPFRPNVPSAYARNNDPQTWGTYQQALTAFETGQCDGIGFCLFGSNIAAFDLDNARDPVTGRIAVEATNYVTRTNSYAEISVSGTGLHVIGLGSGDSVHRKHQLNGSDVGIESYRGAERYIVVTGLPLDDAPLPLANIDAVIDNVIAELDGVSSVDSYNGRDLRTDLDRWIADNGMRYAELYDGTLDDRLLPAKLKNLIADRPPADDRSEAFHHAVCWLHELKWPAGKIEDYIEDAPVVPERYRDRLLREIDRCLCNSDRHKAQAKAKAKAAPRSSAVKAAPQDNKAIALDFFEDFDKALAKRPIIKDVIYRGERSSWVGPPGSGKSALLASVAIHVTDESSDNWRGYRIKAKVGVVYFALERKDLVKRRMRAHTRPQVQFEMKDGMLSTRTTRPARTKLPIAVAGRAIDLLDQSCIDIIVDTVRAAEAHFGCAVGLVIIDTINKGIAMGGGDEDKAKDHNIAAANLQAMQDELPDIHVALIGHTGKDESRGARGSNAHQGDVDMQVQISVNGNVRTATVIKANDGTTGMLTRFMTTPITLGTDEDGDLLTTAIVADDIPPNALSTGLTKSQARAIELLERALDEQGKPANAAEGYPADIMTVAVEVWRQHCYSGGLSATGTDTAKRQAFNRVMKDLLALRRIEVRGDLVWIIPDRVA
jgi:hypothetical protein